MNGRLDGDKVVVEMSADEALEVVKEFDSLPNTRERQKSLKGTDIFPTRVPRLNELVKWLGTSASSAANRRSR